MKSIRIFDKNIKLLGQVDDYEEFKITRRFSSLGEFELKINAKSLHADKLLKNNLLLLERDYNKVCIILHREFNGTDNKDMLFVKGVTLQGLLNRRLIVPDIDNDFESYKGNQETIIKHFVNKNCVNPKDIKRKIDRLVIATDRLRGENDSWRSSYDNLSDKLKEICEFCKLGWNIDLDTKNKQFIFDIIEGKDLTINQSINPPVIFRSDFNNISNRHYIESIINSKNIIYSGTKEDSTKMILTQGESSGFERIEHFNSVNSDDVQELKKQCEIKLSELKELKTFELEVNPRNTFIYEKDYDLGDTVTIQDKILNVTMNSQIVEIEESNNKSDFKLKIIFGSNIPNIISKISNLEKKVN